MPPEEEEEERAEQAQSQDQEAQTTVERLSRVNADIAAAVEHAACAIEALGSSDEGQLDAFKRHADGLLSRIDTVCAEISASAHLAAEFIPGADTADGHADLYIYRSRLGPARQRLHLVNLVATSAAESLAACIREVHGTLLHES